MNKNDDILEIKLEMVDWRQENSKRKLIKTAEKRLRKVFWDKLEGKFGDC
ncbi:MAG: hypothetical protein PHX34_05735 [Candidatus Shapirobacteria bacterium]|nr:hypothetical protein [Candidatus Shapirobacteria bacterium]